MHGTAKVINARTLRSEKIGRQMQLLRPVTERPKFGSRLGNNGHTELPRNTKSGLPDEPPPAVLPFTTLWNFHSLFILIIWKQCAWYYLIKSTYIGVFFHVESKDLESFYYCSVLCLPTCVTVIVDCECAAAGCVECSYYCNFQSHVQRKIITCNP